MTLVVDASVVLKLVIKEKDSPIAHALLLDEELAAPDLLFIECANALWVKARRALMSKAQALAGLQAIVATPIRSVPSRAHIAAAQAIAFELDQSAYDSLYLAVALAEHSVLITADEAFCRAASAHPVYTASVKLLGT